MRTYEPTQRKIDALSLGKIDLEEMRTYEPTSMTQNYYVPMTRFTTSTQVSGS